MPVRKSPLVGKQSRLNSLEIKGLFALCQVPNDELRLALPGCFWISPQLISEAAAHCFHAVGSERRAGHEFREARPIERPCFGNAQQSAAFVCRLLCNSLTPLSAQKLHSNWNSCEPTKCLPLVGNSALQIPLCASVMASQKFPPKGTFSRAFQTC